MSKTLVLYVVLLLSSSGVHSQDSLPGKNRVSIGYGAGNLNYIFHNHHNSSSVEVTGPVYLKYLRRISRRSEFGLSISFKRAHGTVSGYNPDFYFDIKGFNVNVRENFIITDKSRHFQPYVGIGFGFQQYFLTGDSDHYITPYTNLFDDF